MARFKDQAIVIRLRDWSESSQIASLLTAEHGRLSVLAKGAKRMSPSHLARFSGGLELLTLGEAVGMTRPISELATMTEWSLIDGFPAVRGSYAAQQVLMYAADLSGRLLGEQDPYPRSFAALHNLLVSVAEPRALLAFQRTLLEEAGYRPQLDRDVRSGEPLELAAGSAYAFDPVAGGVTGAGSAADEPNGPWKVRGSTLLLLRDGATATTDAAAMERANRLLCVYARALIGRELTTMRVLLGR